MHCIHAPNTTASALLLAFPCWWIWLRLKTVGFLSVLRLPSLCHTVVNCCHIASAVCCMCSAQAGQGAGDWRRHCRSGSRPAAHVLWHGSRRSGSTCKSDSHTCVCVCMRACVCVCVWMQSWLQFQVVDFLSDVSGLVPANIRRESSCQWL